MNDFELQVKEHLHIYLTSHTKVYHCYLMNQCMFIGNQQPDITSRGDLNAMEEEGYWTSLINEFLKNPNTHD